VTDGSPVAQQPTAGHRTPIPGRAERAWPKHHQVPISLISISADKFLADNFFFLLLLFVEFGTIVMLKYIQNISKLPKQLPKAIHLNIY
jgi:hypothetical protein